MLPSAVRRPTQLSSKVVPRFLEKRRSASRSDGATLFRSGDVCACSFVERLITTLQNTRSCPMQRGVPRVRIFVAFVGQLETREHLQVCGIVPRALGRVSRQSNRRPLVWDRPAGYLSEPKSGSSRPTRSKCRASFLCDNSPSAAAAGRKPPSVARAMIPSAIMRSSSKLPGQS